MSLNAPSFPRHLWPRCKIAYSSRPQRRRLPCAGALARAFLRLLFTLSLFATGDDEPAFASAVRFASPPRPEGPASPSRASMDREALKGYSFTCDDEEKEGTEAGVRACGKRPGVVELKVEKKTASRLFRCRPAPHCCSRER